MVMAAPTRPWTRAELARLPDDGNRYEVLDRRLLVTPQASYEHQYVGTQLLIALHKARGAPAAFSVVRPGAVPFGENELQPDIFVIPGAHSTGEWTDLPRPVLVAEVLSESTRRRDFGIKLDAYLNRVGIPEVWLVDRERRVVHVCVRASDPRAVADTLTWLAPGAVEPLRIHVQALFPAKG